MNTTTSWKIAPKFPQRQKRAAAKAFTLMEMLVVIAVMLILMRILLPALSKARQTSYGVICTSNLHQLMLGFRLFAHDHDDSLPGAWFDHNDADPEHRDWASNTGTGTCCYDMTIAPTDGTLFDKYLSHNKNIFLCPAMAKGAVGDSASSNGATDYSAVLVFAGTRTNKIKGDSYYVYGASAFPPAAGTPVKGLATPVIVHELAAYGINGGNRESGHCNTDQMTNVHSGGAFYASIDGAVHFVKYPAGYAVTINDWYSLAPSGNYASLGGCLNPSWNTWSKK